MLWKREAAGGASVPISRLPPPRPESAAWRRRSLRCLFAAAKV
jgi:hypothetical protein